MAQAMTLRQLNGFGLGVPILVVIMLAMMVLPLPPFLLDFLFTFNITLALLVLLAGVYSNRPLEFSIFPTVLLVATLLRLALNVASTRVVLLEGHAGGDAAGSVIEAFGKVVIGGNYAVGLVVFAILVIINFVVVTKGAGRVSEVSARFTLDSMPGKQMAIDADLNAGVIDQEEAKRRRQEVSAEADFYGAMDGSSKFVRGDAIAGILILFINLIGGLAIGVLQHELSVMDAMRVYALLTIGDGLVAQIPSLLLSTAAAIMVTRVSTDENMSEQFKGQLFTKSRPLYITGGILIVMGLVPGMPHMAFLTLGLAVCAGGWYMATRMALAGVDDVVDTQEQQKQSKAEDSQPRDLSWDDVPALDPIGLEVGFRLIPMVDKEQDGELMKRIKGVRKKLSQELGFLLPSVHIRDNLNLIPNGYKVSLNGVILGESEVFPDKWMAINPGSVFGDVDGIDATDPAFGLKAKWIDARQREHAQTLGYTVVDASTVIATHLSQILQTHAHELLGHDEVQKLLDILSKAAPKLVENLIPDTLPLSSVVKVLQNLLREQVPIRDARTIVETLSEYGSKSQDPGALTEAVRGKLSGLIVQQIVGSQGEIPVMTLSPNLEQILQQSLQTLGEEGVGLEPNMADSIQKNLMSFQNSQEAKGEPAILLVAPRLRRMLAKLVQLGASEMFVLGYNEVPDNKQIKIMSTLGQGE